MNEQRQMFPDSRAVLVVFSPILAAFLLFCAYGVHTWGPSSPVDTAGKYLALELLLSLVVLCGLAFVGGVIGPHRVMPLVEKGTGKVGLLAAAFLGGFILLLLWNGLSY